MSSIGKQKDVKKTGHYVPSRYKQAAENVSLQSNPSRERSTFSKNSRDSRELQISANSSQETLSNFKPSTSQDNRGMTSTPTFKGEFPLPLLDASAVTDGDGKLTVPHLKERIGPITSEYTKRNKLHDETLQLHVPVIASYKDRKNGDVYHEKISEAEMDLLYAQYLQAAYLESEAKKVLESRSTCATETLHKFFSLVLEHLHQVKAQKSTLDIISCFIQIHEHCQKQETIFKPVFEIIPSLEKQYKSLAEAINATKHKLHVKDVILPQSGSEDEIIEVLQQLSEFISSFFDLLPNYKEIISSAEILKNYVDAGKLLTDALKRGLSLLIEVKDLCFSEASLKLDFENL